MGKNSLVKSTSKKKGKKGPKAKTNEAKVKAEAGKAAKADEAKVKAETAKAAKADEAKVKAETAKAAKADEVKVKAETAKAAKANEAKVKAEAEKAAKADEAKVKTEVRKAAKAEEAAAPEEKPETPQSPAEAVESKPEPEAPAKVEPEAPEKEEIKTPEPPEREPEPEPKVSVSYEEPVQTAGGDSEDKMMKIGGAILIFLIILIVGASFANTNNYYLKPATDGIEIWKGRFAPKGEKQLLALPGVGMPETIKDVYSKGEVHPLAFQHFIDKADGMLLEPGVPNFDAIKAELKSALEFASEPEMRDSALSRLTQIDMSILLYKTNVAQQRGSVEDLEAALNFLGQTAALDLEPRQAELIDQKKVAVKEQLTELEAQQAEAEKAAAEAAAAEAAAAEAAAAEAAAAEEAAKLESAETSSAETKEGH
jgi:hypothetical protein